MRYAIISDIHGNIEALNAVFDHIETKDVDEIICLGDIVGYGPNPNECIELVKSGCSKVILGNHDYACYQESELEYFNNYARQAIYWTIDTLTESAYSFISKLPLQQKFDNFYLVHSSPANPKDFDMTPNDALLS